MSHAPNRPASNRIERPLISRVRRRVERLVLALALALAPLGHVKHAQALGPNDRRLTNAHWGISVEGPAGWTLSQHTGYSDTIVLLVHPDGSRISVSATLTSARTPADLFAQNRAALVAQGLLPAVVGNGPRGGLVVDLSATGRPERLRQIYLVRDVPVGRQAIVLTLVSISKSFAERLPGLDFVAARLTLDDPLPVGDADRDRGGRGANAVTPGTKPVPSAGEPAR